jgi:hypothetical protein
MRFTYCSGQRPLDGFTIKRGIGRGGFGEVYFAVSDGGKEVALKLLRGDNQDIELRGVVQCLNLKHPNLVALYDLRADERGDSWVVMEYVSGEPLSALLARHPQGLPVELAKEWFVGLARAIGYLHDHGVVHRDLKPANVFLENGRVLIGDYGLSKLISGSQRTRQTQSVGTVHYMAPEISTGNYNKQIDTYAAGVILYEMLTGHVPFEGESAGEILMKHLTSPPDLSRLPPEFVPIVARALSKNPAHRYASMAELARAVEEVGVSEKRIQTAPSPARPPALALPSAAALRGSPATPQLQFSLAEQLGELCSGLTLSALLAGLATAFWAALSRRYELQDLAAVFFLTVVACWVVLVACKFWQRPQEDSWTRRVVMLVLGALVGAYALWVVGWVPHAQPPDPGETVNGPILATVWPRSDVAEAAGYLSYFALTFFALRWWKMTERRRPQRFSLLPVFAAGFWGLMLLLVWPQPWHGAVAVVLASAIVQLVSPWEEPPPKTDRRMRLRYG